MSSRTVLLIGRSNDALLHRVHERLASGGVRVLWLREDRLGHGLADSWWLADAPEAAEDRIEVGGVRVRLDEVDGILNRAMGVVPPAEVGGRDRTYIVAEWIALVNGVTHRASCSVINRLNPELWFAPVIGPMDLPFYVQPWFDTYVTEVTALVSDNVRDIGDRAGLRPPFAYQPISQLTTYGVTDNAQAAKLRELAQLIPIAVRPSDPNRAIRVVAVDGEVLLEEPPTQLSRADREDLAWRVREAVASLGLRLCELVIARPGQTWRCDLASALPLLEWIPRRLQARVVERIAASLVTT